ncbi:hypothetical protein D3C72_2493300 [compost metagenome]
MLGARRRRTQPFELSQRVDAAIHAAVGAARAGQQQFGQVRPAVQVRKLDHPVAQGKQDPQ